MAREKFVVRLLDREHALLGWCEVYAEPKPQETRASCPYFPVTQTIFPIERDGVAKYVTVHWCDLNVARIKEQPEVEVEAGQQVQLHWFEPIWLVGGMQDVPLPAVTVREPVTIVVPTGALNATSQ